MLLIEWSVFYIWPQEKMLLPLTVYVCVFFNHSPKSRLIQLKKEKLEYSPGEHEYGLFPAPIHVGEYHYTQCVAEKKMVFLEFGWNAFAFLLYICRVVKLVSLPFNLYLLWRILQTFCYVGVKRGINLTHCSFNKQHFICSIWLPK